LRLDDLSKIGFVFPDGSFGNQREVLDPQIVRYTNPG
jgi:hypothetical protein